MNMQKFLFLPLTFLFSMSCFASNFSNLSFNKIYNDMYGVCENFKEKSWVSTCDNLNECETVLKTKKNEISSDKYYDYVNKWNTTIAAFDIYSVCRVLKEKTSCINVDCLNAPVKEVQLNINKCSGPSKKCGDWFGKRISGVQINFMNEDGSEVLDSVNTNNLKSGETKTFNGSAVTKGCSSCRYMFSDEDAVKYRALTGANVKNGDTVYYFNLVMNNDYISNLHKMMRLPYKKETEPLMSLYIVAEDVANIDGKITNAVNAKYSEFLSKAVSHVFPDDKTLTVDWMKSCFYEVFADEISEIKALAPTEIQKHNEREKSLGFGGVVTVVKKKASGVISTVKDKAEDIVSIVKNKSENSTSTIKEKSNEIKNYVVPKVKVVKEKASTIVNNGKRKLKGR